MLWYELKLLRTKEIISSQYNGYFRSTRTVFADPEKEFKI